MKSCLHIKNQTIELLVTLLSVRTIKLIFLSLTATLVTSSIAAANNSAESTTAYVDSINQWGAWELDIEPAAGGLQSPTTRPLNARGTKVALRTNSISALAPVAATINPVSPVPLPPVVPVTPPVTPPIPPRIGGPTDGLF